MPLDYFLTWNARRGKFNTTVIKSPPIKQSIIMIAWIKYSGRTNCEIKKYMKIK